MQRKFNKIATDTNLFLKRFIKRQKKSELIIPMKYGLFSGGKKLDQKFWLILDLYLKLITNH